MTYSIRKQQDIEYGIEQENKLLRIIEEYLDIELNKSNNEFSVIDFYNTKEKCYVELKCRTNIPSTNFYTLMIGKNKIDKGIELLKKGCRCILLFNYLDYFYSFELTDDNKDNITYKYYTRTDRGVDEVKEYGYIKKSECDIVKCWKLEQRP